MHQILRLIPVLALLPLVSNVCYGQARMDIVDIPGRLLAGNPMHDPAARRAAVFLPAQAASGAPLPVVYWLPGFGGSSEDAIRDSVQWCEIAQRVADRITPLIFVVIDGRNRWGCSQYIDSPAQGNYAQYICDEIVPLIESRYMVARGAQNRIIAGHSSGGFGALRLGMLRHHLFGHVVALSPDSDFPTTHISEVQDPAVEQLPVAQRRALMGANPPADPVDGQVKYILALSAAYTPIGKAGRFDWPFTADGRFREDVWRRWLDNDPLTLARRHQDAFAPEQTIYLDGGSTDSLKANIGARKICETLQPRKSRVSFFEAPGGHGENVPLRMERGLAWTFGKPLPQVPAP